LANAFKQSDVHCIHGINFRISCISMESNQWPWHCHHRNKL